MWRNRNGVARLLMIGVGALTASTSIAVGGTAIAASAAGSSPVSITAPTIAGFPQVSAYLTASTGTWRNSPSSFTYQWYAGGKPIPSQTRDEVLLSPLEQSHVVTVTVTASNAAGSASESSLQTATVAALPWKAVGFPSGLTSQQMGCASSSACFDVASKANLGNVYLLTFNGVRWVTVKELEPFHAKDLACADDGFCMLLLQARKVGWEFATYFHGKWSTPIPMPKLPTMRYGHPWTGSYNQLNCWSVNLCSATMGGSGYYFGPGDESSGAWLVLYSSALHELGAPSDPTFMPYNKGLSHWTAPIQATSNHHLWSSACTSPNSCVVSDYLAHMVDYFNGRTWSHETAIQWALVGCSSPRFCIGIGSEGGTGQKLWNGHSWSSYRHWGVADATCHAALGCFTAVNTGVNGVVGMGVVGSVVRISEAGLTQSQTIAVVTRNGDYQPYYDDEIQGIDCPSENFCFVQGSRMSFVYRSSFPF
jgi:hypothetical protein